MTLNNKLHISTNTPSLNSTSHIMSDEEKWEALQAEYEDLEDGEQLNRRLSRSYQASARGER